MALPSLVLNIFFILRRVFCLLVLALIALLSGFVGVGLAVFLFAVVRLLGFWHGAPNNSTNGLRETTKMSEGKPILQSSESVRVE